MSLNISVEQAISWLNGRGDEHTILGIRQQGVLTYLENVSTTFLRSRSAYSGSLSGAGTLLWKIPHLVPTKAYAEGQTVGQSAREVPNWDYVQSGEIVRRSGTFKNEYFDYRMAQPEQAVATVEMIVGSLSLSAAADTNAAFWTAINDYFKLHPEQTMYMPNLVARKVLTDEEARELVVQLAHKRNDLTLVYDSKSYGIRPEQFNTVINGAGAINLSQTLVMLNQSVSAFEVAKAMINDPFGQEGKANPKSVIGNKIIIDNMLDLAVAQNVAWSEDTDFDTTGLYGCIIHKDFIAFPTLEPSFGVREVPNNLNHNYIIEYARTHAFLRPKLACGITDFAAYVNGVELKEEGGEYVFEIAAGETKQVKSNIYFGSNVSLSVETGVTGITVDGDKVTAVTAGTYDLTVTDGHASQVLKIKVVA